MGFNNDYFLLYHGVEYEAVETGNIKKTQKDFFCQIAALLLSTTRKELSAYSALEAFNEFVVKLTSKPCNTLEDLFFIQAALIQDIEKNQTEEHIQQLNLAFNYLNAQKLLSHENHKKLLSVFDPKIFHVYEELPVDLENTDSDFIQRKAELETIIQELSVVSENSTFRDDLSSVQTYLQSQRFSIGITGVMNAGKSSLLNALLGAEVLGTSVVPETANLSLLKYSKDPYARVAYWSKDEWQKIVDCGEELESMSLFVKQTEETFKEELDDYIKESGRIDEIMIKDLSLYTSANKSGGRCNLIRQVELGVDLEFLSEGIEIVDTPGLDDIVIQREEITKEYLGQCDLMIHLMNAAQSATQKDIEFIIDTLRYHNVSKLLIVLTRADTLKESELNEVIAYTKESIRSQLEALNEQMQMESLLSSLHFIAVSSKMALYHRTGQSALAIEQGYTLERSGILELERYLLKTLYGNENEKSDLIIRSAKLRLSRSIETEIASLRYELHLLGQSKDMLKTESETITLRREKNEKLVCALKEELQSYKGEIEGYSAGLEVFLDTQMSRVKQRLQLRLSDDFVYALEKKSKKQFMDSISRMVEGSIKDGLIDVVRDYRYKFIQKAEEIEGKIEKQYAEYVLEFDKRSDGVSTLELMNEYFKGNLVYSNSSVLSARLKTIFEKATLKEISSLQAQLDVELSQAFSLVQEILKQKASLISVKLIEEIFANIYKPLDRLEDKLNNEELLLDKRLREFEDDEQKRASASIHVHQQIKSLQAISLRCKV